MPTRTISTMFPLPGQTAGAAASLVLVQDGWIPNLFRVEGYMNGTSNNTQYWIHFFNTTSVPSNGTKPIYSLMILGVNGFTWDFTSESLSGGNVSSSFLPAYTGNLIACLSTTKTTFTAPAGGETFAELEISLEEWELPVLGLSVAGDLTTARQTLTVFTDASGPQRVYRIDATNTTGGATQYLMMFPNASPSTGDLSLLTWTIADTATKRIIFGDGGYVPRDQVVDAATVRDGCYLFVSSTQYTYTAAAGTPWTLRAFYKAL